ncbi:MAG: lysylphosphatidylglycerol synthase domain-containing protein, partial [Candidatus Omnitrophota bacterium]
AASPVEIQIIKKFFSPSIVPQDFHCEDVHFNSGVSHWPLNPIFEKLAYAMVISSRPDLYDKTGLFSDVGVTLTTKKECLLTSRGELSVISGAVAGERMRVYIHPSFTRLSKISRLKQLFLILVSYMINNKKDEKSALEDTDSFMESIISFNSGVNVCAREYFLEDLLFCGRYFSEIEGERITVSYEKKDRESDFTNYAIHWQADSYRRCTQQCKLYVDCSGAVSLELRGHQYEIIRRQMVLYEAVSGVGDVLSITRVGGPARNRKKIHRKKASSPVNQQKAKEVIGSSEQITICGEGSDFWGLERYLSGELVAGLKKKGLVLIGSITPLKERALRGRFFLFDEEFVYFEGGGYITKDLFQYLIDFHPDVLEKILRWHIGLVGGEDDITFREWFGKLRQRIVILEDITSALLEKGDMDVCEKAAKWERESIDKKQVEVVKGAVDKVVFGNIAGFYEFRQEDKTLVLHKRLFLEVEDMWVRKVFLSESVNFALRCLFGEEDDLSGDKAVFHIIRADDSAAMIVFKAIQKFKLERECQFYSLLRLYTLLRRFHHEVKNALNAASFQLALLGMDEFSVTQLNDAFAVVERDVADIHSVTSSKLSIVDMKSMDFGSLKKTTSRLYLALMTTVRALSARGTSLTSDARKYFDVLFDEISRLWWIVSFLQAQVSGADDYSEYMYYLPVEICTYVAIITERVKNESSDWRGIEVKYEFSKNEIWAKVDYHALAGVLINILRNAFDFVAKDKTPNKEKKITVSVSFDEGEVTVKIIDTGPGMTDEVRQRCMQYAFSTRKGKGGYGFGLYITNKTVAAHQGRIGVESELRKGTAFSVVLPRREFDDLGMYGFSDSVLQEQYQLTSVISSSEECATCLGSEDEKGKIINLDGVAGSGKRAAVEKLITQLREQNPRVVIAGDVGVENLVDCSEPADWFFLDFDWFLYSHLLRDSQLVKPFTHPYPNIDNEFLSFFARQRYDSLLAEINEVREFGRRQVIEIVNPYSHLTGTQQDRVVRIKIGPETNIFSLGSFSFTPQEAAFYQSGKTLFFDIKKGVALDNILRDERKGKVYPRPYIYFYMVLTQVHWPSMKRHIGLKVKENCLPKIVVRAVGGRYQVYQLMAVSSAVDESGFKLVSPRGWGIFRTDFQAVNMWEKVYSSPVQPELSYTSEVLAAVRRLYSNKGKNGAIILAVFEDILTYPDISSAQRVNHLQTIYPEITLASLNNILSKSKFNLKRGAIPILNEYLMLNHKEEYCKLLQKIMGEKTDFLELRFNIKYKKIILQVCNEMWENNILKISPKRTSQEVNVVFYNNIIDVGEKDESIFGVLNKQYKIVKNTFYKNKRKLNQKIGKYLEEKYPNVFKDIVLSLPSVELLSSFLTVKCFADFAEERNWLKNIVKDEEIPWDKFYGFPDNSQTEVVLAALNPDKGKKTKGNSTTEYRTNRMYGYPAVWVISQLKPFYDEIGAPGNVVDYQFLKWISCIEGVTDEAQISKIRDKLPKNIKLKIEFFRQVYLCLLIKVVIDLLKMRILNIETTAKMIWVIKNHCNSFREISNKVGEANGNAYWGVNSRIVPKIQEYIMRNRIGIGWYLELELNFGNDVSGGGSLDEEYEIAKRILKQSFNNLVEMKQDLVKLNNSVKGVFIEEIKNPVMAKPDEPMKNNPKKESQQGEEKNPKKESQQGEEKNPKKESWQGEEKNPKKELLQGKSKKAKQGKTLSIIALSPEIGDVLRDFYFNGSESIVDVINCILGFDDIDLINNEKILISLNRIEPGFVSTAEVIDDVYKILEKGGILKSINKDENGFSYNMGDSHKIIKLQRDRNNKLMVIESDGWRIEFDPKGKMRKVCFLDDFNMIINLTSRGHYRDYEILRRRDKANKKGSEWFFVENRGNNSSSPARIDLRQVNKEIIINCLIALFFLRSKNIEGICEVMRLLREGLEEQEIALRLGVTREAVNLMKMTLRKYMELLLRNVHIIDLGVEEGSVLLARGSLCADSHETTLKIFLLRKVIQKSDRLMLMPHNFILSSSVTENNLIMAASPWEILSEKFIGVLEDKGKDNDENGQNVPLQVIIKTHPDLEIRKDLMLEEIALLRQKKGPFSKRFSSPAKITSPPEQEMADGRWQMADVFFFIFNSSRLIIFGVTHNLKSKILYGFHAGGYGLGIIAFSVASLVESSGYSSPVKPTTVPDIVGQPGLVFRRQFLVVSSNVNSFNKVPEKIRFRQQPLKNLAVVDFFGTFNCPLRCSHFINIKDPLTYFLLTEEYLSDIIIEMASPFVPDIRSQLVGLYSEAAKLKVILEDSDLRLYLEKRIFSYLVYSGEIINEGGEYSDEINITPVGADYFKENRLKIALDGSSSPVNIAGRVYKLREDAGKCFVDDLSPEELGAHKTSSPVSMEDIAKYNNRIAVNRENIVSFLINVFIFSFIICVILLFLPIPFYKIAASGILMNFMAWGIVLSIVFVEVFYDGGMMAVKYLKQSRFSARFYKKNQQSSPVNIIPPVASSNVINRKLKESFNNYVENIYYFSLKHNGAPLTAVVATHGVHRVSNWPNNSLPLPIECFISNVFNGIESLFDNEIYVLPGWFASEYAGKELNDLYAIIIPMTKFFEKDVFYRFPHSDYKFIENPEEEIIRYSSVAANDLIFLVHEDSFDKVKQAIIKEGKARDKSKQNIARILQKILIFSFPVIDQNIYGGVRQLDLAVGWLTQTSKGQKKFKELSGGVDVYDIAERIHPNNFKKHIKENDVGDYRFLGWKKTDVSSSISFLGFQLRYAYLVYNGVRSGNRKTFFTKLGTDTILQKKGVCPHSLKRIFWLFFYPWFFSLAVIFMSFLVMTEKVLLQYSYNFPIFILELIICSVLLSVRAVVFLTKDIDSIGLKQLKVRAFLVMVIASGIIYSARNRIKIKMVSMNLDVYTEYLSKGKVKDSLPFIEIAAVLSEDRPMDEVDIRAQLNLIYKILGDIKGQIYNHRRVNQIMGVKGNDEYYITNDSALILETADLIQKLAVNNEISSEKKYILIKESVYNAAVSKDDVFGLEAWDITARLYQEFAGENGDKGWVLFGDVSPDHSRGSSAVMIVTKLYCFLAVPQNCRAVQLNIFSHVPPRAVLVNVNSYFFTFQWPALLPCKIYDKRDSSIITSSAVRGLIKTNLEILRSAVHKGLTKKLLSITILTIILSSFTYYIYSHWADFTQIKISRPLLIIPLVIIAFLPSITNGLIIKYLVAPFNLKLGFKEWFGLSVITTFYNTIFPFRGGLIAKATYLKEKYSFPFFNYVAMMAGIYVISFLVAGFFGLVSLLFIYLFYRIFNSLILIVFVSVFLASFFIVLFSPKLPETKNSFLNKIIKVANGWHLIKGNRKIIFVSFAVEVVQILISVFSTTLLYRIFNIDISFVKALFLISIGKMFIFTGITPAGLGISEAIAVFSALVIGIRPAESLSAATLNRIIGTVVIFILGPIFSYLLIKKEKNPEDVSKESSGDTILNSSPLAKSMEYEDGSSFFHRNSEFVHISFDSKNKYSYDFRKEAFMGLGQKKVTGIGDNLSASPAQYHREKKIDFLASLETPAPLEINSSIVSSEDEAKRVERVHKMPYKRKEWDSDREKKIIEWIKEHPDVKSPSGRDIDEITRILHANKYQNRTSPEEIRDKIHQLRVIEDNYLNYSNEKLAGMAGLSLTAVKTRLRWFKYKRWSSKEKKRFWDLFLEVWQKTEIRNVTNNAILIKSWAKQFKKPQKAIRETLFIFTNIMNYFHLGFGHLCCQLGYSRESNDWRRLRRLVEEIGLHGWTYEEEKKLYVNGHKGDLNTARDLGKTLPAIYSKQNLHKYIILHQDAPPSYLSQDLRCSESSLYRRLRLLGDVCAISRFTSPSGFVEKIEIIAKTQMKKYDCFFKVGMTLPDLVSYGMIGFYNAQRLFDPAKGVKFRIFAEFKIIKAIWEGYRECNPLSRFTHKYNKELNGDESGVIGIISFSPDIEQNALFNSLEAEEACKNHKRDNEIYLMRDLIGRLPNPRWVKVIEMGCIGGLEHKEIGEILGISSKTVTDDIYQAKQYLRQLLENDKTKDASSNLLAGRMSGNKISSSICFVKNSGDGILNMLNSRSNSPVLITGPPDLDKVGEYLKQYYPNELETIIKRMPPEASSPLMKNNSKNNRARPPLSNKRDLFSSSSPVGKHSVVCIRSAVTAAIYPSNMRNVVGTGKWKALFTGNSSPAKILAVEFSVWPHAPPVFVSSFYNSRPDPGISMSMKTIGDAGNNKKIPFQVFWRNNSKGVQQYFMNIFYSLWSNSQKNDAFMVSQRINSKVGEVAVARDENRFLRFRYGNYFFVRGVAFVKLMKSYTRKTRFFKDILCFFPYAVGKQKSHKYLRFVCKFFKEMYFFFIEKLRRESNTGENIFSRDIRVKFFRTYLLRI